MQPAETNDITLKYASPGWRRVVVLPVITLVLVALVSITRPNTAEGADSLSVRPITWDVIGLDSNKVTDGPARFPVGARICNTGGTSTGAVSAHFVWDSTNAHLSLVGPSSVAVGTLAVSACADVFFDVAVARDKAAWNTARGYHIEVLVGSATITRTPTNRQLYVEKLVSQNRNAITAITGGGGLTDAPTTLVDVGSTYRYQLHGKTATNGYEQLESLLDFPTTMFRVVGVRATYTAPTGGVHDAVYADACGWDPTTTSSAYRSCIGPTSFGGKAGGDITLTYDVLVTGAGTALVSGLIYDFSGSSYHYNGDYGTALKSVEITAVTPTSTTTTVAPTTTTVPTTTTTVPTTTTTVPTTTTIPPTTTTIVPTTTTAPPTTTTTVPTTTTTIPPTTTTVPTTTTTIPPTTTTVPTTTTTAPPTTTTTAPPTTTTTAPPTTTTTAPPTTIPPTTTTTAPPTTTTIPPTTTTIPPTTTTVPTTTTTTVPTTTTTVPTTTTTIPPTTTAPPATTTTIPPTTTTTVPLTTTTTTVPATTTTVAMTTTVPTTTVPAVGGGVPTTTVPSGPDRPPTAWVTPVPDVIFGTGNGTPSAAPTFVAPTEPTGPAEATGTVADGTDRPETTVAPSLPRTGSSTASTLAVAAVLLATGSLISRIGRRRA